MHWFILDEQVT